MVEYPEIYFGNILNLSAATITPSSNAADAGLLYNYSKLYPWIASGTANQSIVIDAGSTIEADTLILDNVTNLQYKDVQWRGSTDNFVGSDVLISAVNTNNLGNLLCRATTNNYRYHKVFMNGGAIIRLGEIFIGKRYQIPCPDAPFAAYGMVDPSLIGWSNYATKSTKQKTLLHRWQPNWETMAFADYETFKYRWSECHNHKPFYFAWRPITEPENVCLVLEMNQKFNAPIHSMVRTNVNCDWLEVL